MSHDVTLTEEQKIKWFQDRVDERRSVENFQSQRELADFLRDQRDAFIKLFGRDVSGSFFKKINTIYGIVYVESELYRVKKEYIHKLLDENDMYRSSKKQLKMDVERHFDQSIASVTFNQIWDEWHQKPNKPEAKVNVDIFGQKPLF